MVKIKKIKCGHVESRERPLHCTIVMETYRLPKGVRFLEDAGVERKLISSTHAEVCLECVRTMG